VTDKEPADPRAAEIIANHQENLKQKTEVIVNRGVDLSYPKKVRGGGRFVEERKRRAIQHLS
jgi:hypothetical protein